MSNELLESLRALTDEELVARLNAMAARERGATAELVAHLAELDTRDVHFREGYGSLFAYCRDALGLSEAEAYTRIEAARAARRFPVILDLLVEGAVGLTSVRLLAPHLTEENHRAVLESARGKRKLQVEEIAARLAPRAIVPPDTTRRLAWPRAVVVPIGVAAAATPASPPTGDGPPSLLPEAAVDVQAAGAPGEPPALRYRIQVTVGAETFEKLRLARDMLRHVLLDRALTVLLADLARKKFAAVENPRPGAAAPQGSRHVPAEVKRAVWLRDLGRCAFVAESGRRCDERGFLEFHHVRPYAAGGEGTVGNVQLRCRRHNDYERRVYFDGLR
jgi:hypothetical protein